MIPLQSFTPTTALSEYLVTTKWEFAYYLLIATVISYLLGVIVQYLEQRKYEQYLASTHQTDRFKEWKKKRSQQRRELQ